MLTTELVLTIPGEARTKGSLKCVGQNGHHQLVEQLGRPAKEWRTAVAFWVKRKWTAAASKGQPVGAEVTFTMKRPAFHYGTGKNKGILKDRYVDAHPVSHAVGDIDKLLRLVLDAIQDTPVLPDDCAVVEVTGRKVYTRSTSLAWGDELGYPGVVIRLYPIGDGT